MGFAAVLSNDAFLVLSVARVPHSTATSQGSQNKHPLQQTFSVGLAALFGQRTKFYQELVIEENRGFPLLCASECLRPPSFPSPLTLQLSPSVLPIPQRISTHLTHCSSSRQPLACSPPGEFVCIHHISPPAKPPAHAAAIPATGRFCDCTQGSGSSRLTNTLWEANFFLKALFSGPFMIFP